ncbi:inositol polyphosphate 5-phosphatase OCRL isoform X2 [Coccinella septempunctata]|uniref:inositol polyphosphate 5-phosphatase OCRL isoform X2 n=1 Tax=Coccinella septempunctata TaxID=41139 RepID=UPI001D066A94|nr:inositol polyphosphate 5-phosphatase OCRL isoform X2 [Coccinella septempunctata]
MLSVHRDVLQIIQAKFSSLEIVKSVSLEIHLNVSLPDDFWSEYFYILAIVVRNHSPALFLFSSKKAIPVHLSDLQIESVIPIDEHFNCYPITGDLSHLFFIVKYRRVELIFKIGVGQESSDFASELIKSKEGSHSEETDYQWLTKYTNLYECSNNTNTEIQYPDISFIRQNMTQNQSSINRESMIKYQLKLKEPEYIHYQEFTIFIGTWNVNGQLPTVSLKPWLSCDNNPPDLYAVGFQEIDLSKEAFLFNDTPREAEWEKMVYDGVHPKAKYRTVALTRLVGIQLIVLINVKHYQFIRNIAVDTVGTGLLGKMGNKGGVAVRLELHNTSLCFVNSHLAAHVEEFERRNQDYKDINARINFKRYPTSIKNHDQVYWLGDLNYRITELTTSQVKTLLLRNEMNALLKADQLNQQKERGNVLLDYTEADITFPPTYKYDLNSDTFDTSEKARPPAWTDRILYRGRGIYQLEYRSHMDLRISDHKPVSGVFKSEISVIDQAKFRKVHEELLKRLDKLENEFLPQVTVDQTEVKFGLIKFREPQFRDIIIANTGQVPAEYEFIKKLDEQSYCKEWMRITPYYGIVNPGEKIDIRLEVNLETDVKDLEDILVLHLNGGKDMFIIVTGTGEKTSFTTSMAALCRAPVPIMYLTEEQFGKIVDLEGDVLYSVPRELWLLIDHLYKYGLGVKDLFESNSTQENFVKLRDWLDFGSSEPIPVSVETVAESLLIFLSYTKEPVIPFHLHDAAIAASSNYQNCKNIINQKLPDIHRNVFLYICMFLQEFLRHSNENGYDAKTLASLFGEILLRDPIRNSKPQASRGKSNFLYNFLVNDLSTSIIPMK